jgi:hypothetical protein
MGMIEGKRVIAEREYQQRLAEKKQREEREAEEKKRAEKEAEMARFHRMPLAVLRGMIGRMESRRKEAEAKLEDRWIGRADYDRARASIEACGRWLAVLRGDVTPTEKDLDEIASFRKEAMPA